MSDDNPDVLAMLADIQATRDAIAALRTDLIARLDRLQDDITAIRDWLDTRPAQE